MAVISRLQLDHPALGTVGGAGLHAAVQALYQKIGDNLADRLFYVSALADTASVDLEHNYRVAFANIRWDLYLWDTGTQELTLITSATSPAISSFTVAATGGFTTTKATLTNNSGASRDLVLVMFNDPVQLDELTDVDISGATSGDVLKFNGTQWIRGTQQIAGGVIAQTTPIHTLTAADEGKVLLCTSSLGSSASFTMPGGYNSGTSVFTTAAPHGFTTGEPIVFSPGSDDTVSNSGPGYQYYRVYFAINISANQFAYASSYTNALADSRSSVATPGSGPVTVQAYRAVIAPPIAAGRSFSVKIASNNGGIVLIQNGDLSGIEGIGGDFRMNAAWGAYSFIGDISTGWWRL